MSKPEARKTVSKTDSLMYVVSPNTALRDESGVHCMMPRSTRRADVGNR